MVPSIVRRLHCAQNVCRLDCTHILCTCAIVLILTGFLLLILLRQQIFNCVNLHIMVLTHGLVLTNVIVFAGVLVI